MRNFLEQYKNLKSTSIVAICIFGTGTSAAMFLLLPWVLSFFLAPPVADFAKQTASTQPIGYAASPDDLCEATQIGRDAIYKLDFQRKIKASDSPRLVFSILLDPELKVMCHFNSSSPRLIKANAELRSVAFDIEPQGKIQKEGETIEWVWTVKPKSAGTQSLQLVVEGSDVFSANLSRLQSLLKIGQQSKTEIGMDVDVRTDLGLTPTQDALFKLIGAVIGLLGTILGFPFFKAALENKEHKPKKKSTASNKANGRSMR
ncbi:hypothetical protein IVG45_13815 [Methylomonas sp. LL1]|uniref:hypothetical protein n=1 Tax=Methylomonas sp. LL1 TaxID=2785785 RepID=UPI0018C42CBB|nr:hypothetical protein [Methylomonas sp. LL1]QPK61936.1 hypothetical protein IVG45_13815 [Methylomonas sp. LL1]